MKRAIAAWLLLCSGVIGTAVAHSPTVHAIQEDSPDWDCSVNGNRICGPNNQQGLTAGCYSDSGVIVAPWPCHIAVNADGSADVFVN